MRHSLPILTSALMLLVPPAPGIAADWHGGFYLDGGGWWPRRIKAGVFNESPVDLEGRPVGVAIGNGPGQAALVGHMTESIRICDARGTELLFALYGPGGYPVADGLIDAGRTLLIPAECAANHAGWYLHVGNARRTPANQ